jgi:peptidoglycan/xylan/chitin deacetylase (PgdA/CDA1 family)
MILSAPFSVCALPSPAKNTARTVSYPHYIHEILQHAGLCYATYEPAELETLSDLRLLLTVGEAPLTSAQRDGLRAWVEAGGAWISIGGVCGLAEMFGVEVEAPAYASWGGGQGTLGEGYLQPADTGHPVLAHLEIPLHFFNGVPVRATDTAVLAHVLDAHQRPTGRAAVVEKRVGKGRCLLIAPDLTGAVVRIQQGIAVTRDGVPASDGTAPAADDVLKSGDGGVLDWIFDRQPVPGVPGYSAFLQPVADQWRELALRSLFALAEAQEMILPLLWLYPRNLPALAHLSHDSDGNDPEHAALLLETLQAAEARSTWCILLPGYPPETIRAIRAAGHELAMHYDAMSANTLWSDQTFHEQWRLLAEQFGGQPPVSNKNHFLRWEGDCALFDWCDRHGLRLDQSKGASKSGEAGFNFGSCHPYTAVHFDGSRYAVLELPTPTQDLNVFAPQALLEPLLRAVEKHHGVLHLLFHPAHIGRPDVRDALSDAVRQARERGLEWWTAEQIGTWENARRRMAWTHYERKRDWLRLHLHAAEPLSEATVLLLNASPGAAQVNGVTQETQTVTRWGFAFQSVTCDLTPERDHSLELAIRSEGEAEA